MDISTSNILSQTCATFPCYLPASNRAPPPPQQQSSAETRDEEDAMVVVTNDDDTVVATEIKMSLIFDIWQQISVKIAQNKNVTF
jgi:hypothetical protein